MIMKQKNMAMPQTKKLIETLKADSNKKIVGVLEGLPAVINVRVNKGVITMVDPISTMFVSTVVTRDWEKITERLFWAKMNNPGIVMWTESL